MGIIFHLPIESYFRGEKYVDLQQTNGFNTFYNIGKFSIRFILHDWVFRVKLSTTVATSVYITLYFHVFIMERHFSPNLTEIQKYLSYN